MRRKPRSGGGASGTGLTAKMPDLNRAASVGKPGNLPTKLLATVDGAAITEFTTFDAVYSARNRVLGMETVAQDFFSTLQNAGLGTTTFLQSSVNNTRDLIYIQMVDALARKYANAQNLFLTSANDLNTYVDPFMGALSTIISLVSLYNSDGYNEVLSKIAQAGGTNRAAVQSLLDRIQTLPIPPGMVDLVCRNYGCFANEEGDVVWMNVHNNTGNATVLDMTLAASWTTLVANATTDLNTVITASESGTIRIVLEEWLGDPIAIPTPGLRLGRSLAEQFRVQACLGQGATNVFCFPYLVNGGTTIADITLPVWVPAGCESDPMWATLLRLNFAGLYNNVVKANADYAGAFTSTALGTSIRAYPVGNGASGVTTLAPGTPLNGYTNSLNDLLFACMPANSEAAPFTTEQRGLQGYSVFDVPLSELIEQTNQWYQRTWINKARWPYPAGTREYNVARLSNRMLLAGRWTA